MKTYEVYAFRRISLRWTREQLAEKAGIDPLYVKFYEEGKRIGRDYEIKIKDALYDGCSELSRIDHYKSRILELAYEIMYEEDVRELLKRTTHMMNELSTLQRDTLDSVIITEV